MPTHIVRQGECLSSLAAPYGLSAGDLYNHPANAALKKKRPNPNILAPGDEVFIPETNPKWVASATGRTHLFTVTRPKVKLRLALLSADGQPYEGKRFAVVVGSRTLEGRTASGGSIEVDIPAEAQSAHLRVWFNDDDPDADIDRELAIGHLDPIDLLSGVQGRLANLGYPCRVTGERDEATLIALSRFREKNGLAAVEGPDANDAIDGEQAEEAMVARWVDLLIDDPLREKLQELYEGA